MTTGSADRERSLIEAAPNAIVLMGSYGRITMVNRQAESLFGYDRTELLGQSVEMLVPERFRAQHPRLRDAYMALPTSRPMGAGRELYGLRKDRTEVPIEIGLNPIQTDEGAFVLASIIDITERKRLDGILRRAEERQRTIVEAAPNAILVVADDGRIDMVNRQAELLFGYPRQELLGSQVEVLVPQRYRGEHPRLRSNFFSTPTTRLMGAGRDLYGLRKDGSEVPIEIGLNPIETEEGAFVLASIIDITQRKRGEDLMRASLAEKETLLREIHHRVKNNMQVVSSLLSLQSNSIDDERYRVLFADCQARVRAMALVHEMLYSAGNLASLDCRDYLRELTQNIVRSSSAAATAVELSLGDDALLLDIQTAIPIGLILNELVVNAFKHGNGSRVSIRLARLDGERYRLSVGDDGSGLPEGFEPAQSKGLGLRMVLGLVRQIDGTVSWRTDRGTTFLVEFENRTAQVTAAGRGPGEEH